MNGHRKVAAWAWVGSCTLAIFSIVPLARLIQNFVSSRWGRAAFGFTVLGGIGAAFLGLVYILYFRLKTRSLPRYLWLTVILGLYVQFTLRLWRAPEEAVHFLEYGLLGFLLFRALSLTIRDKSVYLTAFLAGSLVGTADEILQWLTPGRYWDFRDVGLNALAAGLIQVALWKGVRPAIIDERPRPKALKRVSVLLAVQVIVLGLCASNTPARVARLAARFPSLAFLLREEPMYEFTIKHIDPEAGVFFSRLSLAGLEADDINRSDEWVRVLAEWKDKSYADFLAHYSPLIHPFLYEMRIHIFRRDRKFEEGRRAKTDKARREAFFVAFRENRILEKHFRRTLVKSGYQWNPELRAEAAAAEDSSRPYRSPVSAGRFQVKERDLWAGIALLLLGLAAANLAGAQKARQVRPQKLG
jgi:VanZ like family